MTIVISFVLIAGASLFVRYARVKNALLAPVAITILNILSPTIVSTLTSFESHPSETSNSTSRYLKLTIFRWVFTAVLTTIVTPSPDDYIKETFQKQRTSIISKKAPLLSTILMSTSLFLRNHT